MVWYKELGYKKNPVESNPLKSHYEPVGYEDEIDRLLYYVEAEGAVLIEGPKSSGKTLLLSQVIDKFGGRGKVIYVDGNKVNKRMDISRLLSGNQNFMRRALGRAPKDMILLLDNAFALPRKSYELLQYYFDQGHLKSVVFTTDDREKLEFPNSLRDRIGRRIIQTKPLSMEDAIDLVSERLKQDLISKDKLEKIYIISDKDMERFLKNTEKVLEYMVEEELEDIDVKTITKVLNADADEEKEEQTEDPNVCEACNAQLVQVGGHYRCENCDLYCPMCGVLIELEDYECPNCGVEFEDEEDE